MVHFASRARIPAAGSVDVSAPVGGRTLHCGFKDRSNPGEPLQSDRTALGDRVLWLWHISFPNESGNITFRVS